jgi:hypothetical protein
MKGQVLLIFLLIHLSSLSQTECLQVKDENDVSIPYATMVIKKNNLFFVGDSSGKFCARFLAKVTRGDTILLSAIGYEDLKTVFISSTPIVLKQKNISLPEIIIANGEGTIETWGTKKNPGVFGGYFCTQAFSEILNSQARIIFPEGSYKKAEIQSVAFYDQTGKGIDVPVRVRVFLLGKDSLPIGDYLKENIILNTKGIGWIEADLKDFGLIIPKEGIAVAIELFVVNEDLYYVQTIKGKDGKKHERKMYGFSLGREKKTDGFLTLSRFSGWYPWRVERFNNFPCGNLVCRVKVKVWR